MTFGEYWAKNEPFGSDPEDVAQLAWDAAVEATEKAHASDIVQMVREKKESLLALRERAARVTESYYSSDPRKIATLIRKVPCEP